MRSRELVNAAPGSVSWAGAKDVETVRAICHAEPGADPRAVALELGKTSRAVTDRRMLRRAELRGDCIFYRWTEDEWRKNLWIGIGLALAQKRPGLKKCGRRSSTT